MCYMKKPSLSLKSQAGFTLIELMVVVVIVAVVVSVAVLSFARVNSDRLQTEKAKMQVLLQQVLDEAAFKQKLILVVPNKAGLRFYSQKAYQWQEEGNLQQVSWPEYLEVDWQLDTRAVNPQILPKEEGTVLQGWLFWPNGEVLAGQITFTMLDGGREVSRSLAWDEQLEFSEVMQ